MGLMNIIPGWRYVSAGVGVVVLLLAGWWVAKTWIISPSDLPDKEEEALELACEKLVQALQEHLIEVDRGRLVVSVADVWHDTSNKQVRKTLESVLSGQDQFKVAGRDVLDEIGGVVKSWVSSKEKPSAEEVLSEQGELDAVLFTGLEGKHTFAREARVSLQATLYEWRVDQDGKRQEIETFEFAVEGIVPLDGVVLEGEEATGLGFFGWLWRSLVSIVGALAIPFLFLPATDWVTKRGSNLLGYAYLIVVVVSALAPCMALMLFDPEGGGVGSYVFGVLLLAVTAVWTYKMHDAWSDRI